MTQTELSEKETLKFISSFTEKVKTNKGAGEFPEGSIDGEFSNRGNKLKEGSDLVHRDKIDGFNNDIETIAIVHYNRQQRAVVKRRRLDTYNYPSEGEGEDEGDDQAYYDEDDDPYAGIDLEKVLAPIQQVTDIVTRDSISKTYTGKILRHLAQQAIEVIEKEQDTVIQFSSLLDTLLGDDSSKLLEAKLLLPEYDLNLTEEQQQQQLQKETEDSDKRITRRQSNQEIDPFFALPGLKIDPDYGLTPEDADEARQLTQIALQRNEEFIRNLSVLRNGLARAQYVKEKIFNWAREMNGDPDESDLYQKELAIETAAKEAKEAEKLAAKKKESSNSSSSTPAPEPTRRSNRRRRN